MAVETFCVSLIKQGCVYVCTIFSNINRVYRYNVKILSQQIATMFSKFQNFFIIPMGNVSIL